MFLKSLVLENVRCFENLSLDFSEPEESIRRWTIVIGENGTGKSTILRAAALVTCGSDALVEHLDDPNTWIRNGADGCKISAQLQTKAGEVRDISISINKGDSRSDVISASKSTLEPLDDAIEKSSRNYFVTGYGASRRLSSASLGKEGGRYGHVRARSVATLFDYDTTLNPLESWAMDVDYRNPKGGMETIRSVLAGFLPGLKFIEIDKKERQLIFDTPDGKVPLHQLSDGYKSVAAWIGDLLYRITNIFEDYRNPLHTRGVLIIDEIDLHLHPLWQRALHEFLNDRLPNMQMLVTTHSPMFVQQLGLDQVQYLKRAQRSVNLYEFGANPSQMLISQLLVSEAFGVPTDESLSTERIKDRYRDLRDKSDLTEVEQEEVQELSSKLATTVQSSRSEEDLSEDQAELLERISSELQEWKK